jgi:hypothetical protein
MLAEHESSLVSPSQTQMGDEAKGKKANWRGMVYLFLWCLGIAFIGNVVSGAPTGGIDRFLGQVAALLLMGWAITWLIERFKPAVDFDHRLRRIAVTAFVAKLVSIPVEMDGSGASTEEAFQRFGGLVVVGIGLAVAVLASILVFRGGRKIAPIISVRWRSRSKSFRAWAFLSFSWAVGTLLFVWLFDPYNLGSLSYMDDEEFAHLVSLIVIPPLFFGGLWFGYRRFVA